MPFQVEAVKLLEPGLVRHEMVVLQRHFRAKRDYVLGRLGEMGIELAVSFFLCVEGGREGGWLILVVGGWCSMFRIRRFM